MRRLYWILVPIWVCSIIFGCGGTKQMLKTSITGIPDWFTSPPEHPDSLFAANTAMSQDMQLAVDKATAGARNQIASQVEVKVEGLQKRFDEEVGMGQNAQLLQQFTTAGKQVVSMSLKGSKVIKQKLSKEENAYRAYVLVSYPVGGTSVALLEQIKNNNLMYTRFRASQTFKELEAEVQNYEQLKKEQKQR